jgi:hypothetical protein
MLVFGLKIIPILQLRISLSLNMSLQTFFFKGLLN